MTPRALIVAACAALPLPALAQAPAVANAAVYNRGGGENGYNSMCNGWSWQTGGYLRATGQPLPFDGNNNIVNGGNIVGHSTLNGGGWISTVNNGLLVADLDSTGLQDVFDAFPNNTRGTLHISTHGDRIQPRPARRGAPLPPARNGGLIHLDNQAAYAGFGDPNANPAGPGTGDANRDPFVFNHAANGRQIQLDLYNCWSGLDPDGAGPLRSVAYTAFGPNGAYRIPGVTSAPSSQTVVQCTAFLTASSPGLTPAQSGAAVLAYMASAPGRRALGNKRTPLDYISGLRFADHYSSLVNNLGAVPFPLPNNPNYIAPISWTIQYLQTTALRGSDPFPTDFPVTYTPSDGAYISYTNPTGQGFGADFDVSNIVGASGRGGVQSLHVGGMSSLPGIAPLGTELATGVFDLTPYGGFLTGVDGTAILQFDPEADLSTLRLYSLIGGVWLPLSGTPDIDTSMGTIAMDFSYRGSMTTDSGFMVAGFAVPTPGAGVLLMCAAGLAACRRRIATAS